jgi:8-oxo-dGTP pyrophosphatase MutT (NUDIX family)
MNDTIPEGARPVARVLLMDSRDRLLLLCAEEKSNGHRFWLTPGGGLEGGETFEQAAVRELLEETGLEVPIGRWVWTRHHIYSWNGQDHNQYERFFVARTEDDQIRPRSPDGYIIGHRWWSASEIGESSEDFAPRRLAPLFAAILRGDVANHAIDCGI